MKRIQTFTLGKYMVKVWKNLDMQEFLCRLYVGGKLYEPADYFTDSRPDAMGSAQAMLKEAHSKGFAI